MCEDRLASSESPWYRAAMRTALLTAFALTLAACPSEEANTPSTGPSDPASHPEPEPNTPEPPAAETGETGKPST